MKAMILAAGRGERMRELTQTVPKPLLKVGGRYLIEYMLLQLKKAGIQEVVINVSYLAEQVQTALGDGRQYNMHIQYSVEPERLETGGGITNALPLLGEEPFLVVSSDIMTDFPLNRLLCRPSGLAHLVMTANPPYHQEGDFGLSEGKISHLVQPKLTFANMGVYQPDLFANREVKPFRLAELLNQAILAGQVTGEYYEGMWFNVGTPADLMAANNFAMSY